MTRVSQNFPVDMLFLYGTTLVQNGAGQFVPAFTEGQTDWGRRALTLPVVSKEMQSWSGQFQTSEVSVDLVDIDGSVSLTLGSSPFGKPFAVYSKVTDNPTYWYPIFSGNVTSVERIDGKTKLTCEDNFRNLYNSRFVPDYLSVATRVNGQLYGTVLDAVGTSVYLNDRFERKIIKVTHADESDGWFGAVFGGITGALLGAISGGVGWGIAAAAGFGALANLPSGGHGAYEESFIRISDYNTIPDDIISGGQNAKFYHSLVDARADGINGSLYSIPSVKIRGGTFTYGVYGTVEIDDLTYFVHPGDYIYLELPILYRGSPDDIIVNMLCGSNSSIRYEYPKDFSSDWFEQTAPLRHFDAWSVVTNTENGGVIDAIDSLAKEFSFSFYVDETNRFALKTLNNKNFVNPNIIGTFTEGYNVVGEGIRKIDDIKTSYTDVSVKFKDAIAGNAFEQTYDATFNSATYFGGLRRVLTIDSKWLHDRDMIEYSVARIGRKYGSVVSKIKAKCSLYSVPVSLGMIGNFTGWSIGTNKRYEITAYSKDSDNSQVDITGEDYDFLYRDFGFFKVSSVATLNATSVSGFATNLVTATINSLYGTIGGHTQHVGGYFYDNKKQRLVMSYLTEGETRIAMQVGSYYMFNTNEIFQVLSVDSDVYNSRLVNYTISRGEMNTVVRSVSAPSHIYTFGGVTATVTNLNASLGNKFIWY